MEVFFRGLQPGCKENKLTDYLTRVFAEFNIAPHEFICEKKKKSARTATAVILDQQKAERFLAQYGHRRGALNLNGPFTCERSKFGVEEYKLRSLWKRFEEGAKNQVLEKDQPDDKTFWANWIACGVWCHDGELPSFKCQYISDKPAKILFGKKDMAFYLPIGPLYERENRIVIEYSTIQSMASCVHHSTFLTFTLDRAPRFYDPEPTPMDLSDYFASALGLSRGFIRRDDPKRPRACAIDQQHAPFAESCLVYQIDLHPQHLPKVKKLLKKHEHLPEMTNRHFLIESPFIKFDTEMKEIRDRISTSDLSFATKFQLQRLVQSSFLSPKVVEYLIEPVQALEKDIGMERVVNRLQQLSRQLPIASPDEESKFFSTTYIINYLTGEFDNPEEETLSAFELARRHPHMVVVHRARVTPAGIYLHGPYAEGKNGVLEKFSDFALGHFLRISFEDENGEQLKWEPGVDLSHIHHNRFNAVMVHGIVIAGRRFEFLGFSHSSLRESSCWFLAPFQYNGSQMVSKDLIAQLGDFSHIRSPAKCGARIGQAFTDLNDNVHIPKSAVFMVPDIERNGRCFSDGCSTASQEVFEKLWKNIRPGELKPTVFQIRYGGVKGLISLDRSLKGLVMNIRPSQMKFPSEANMLGICGAAKRTLPMYLNRPMIKILEDLGIATDTFMLFQDAAVKDLRLMTESVINAATFAENNDIGKTMSFSWLLRELYHLGIPALEDHFLWSAIELIVIMRVRDIKYKARIPLKMESGVTLFGIMDETNTLRPGEIYCTINEGEVVTGTVAITRSPAMHPGDIQSALAVDVPEQHPLKSLHNVVVFSQQGDRDLPSMLSGGDLDGDLFNVIRDPKLQPTFSVQPADYPRPKPIDLGRPVGPRDIIDFFIDFMANDLLGQIASKHLQMADQKFLGTRDNNCILLAEMHSTAVDFSKTGIPVDMFKSPRLPSKCKPDFMANGPRVLIENGVSTLQGKHEPGFYYKNEHDILTETDGIRTTPLYYESDNALGHLYRKIDEYQLLKELEKARRNNNVESRSALTQLWTYLKQRCQGWQWEHLKPWAQGVKKHYNDHVAELMYQYALDPHRPLTELEVFLGIVMGKDGGLPSRRAREIANSMRDHFNEAVHYTMDYILQGGEEDEIEGALERSLACLEVALEEDDDDEELDKKIGKLQSFGYLAATISLRQVQQSRLDGY